MITNAELHVDGGQFHYDILYMHFESHRSVDKTGRPSSPVQYAHVYLELHGVQGDALKHLISWGATPNRSFDCQIIQTHQHGSRSQIDLRDTCCVDYLEKFSYVSDVNARRHQTESWIVCVTLTARYLGFTGDIRILMY